MLATDAMELGSEKEGQRQSYCNINHFSQAIMSLNAIKNRCHHAMNRRKITIRLNGIFEWMEARCMNAGANITLLTCTVDWNRTRSICYCRLQEPRKSKTQENVKYIASHSIWNCHITISWIRTKCMVIVQTNWAIHLVACDASMNSAFLT